MGARQQRAAEMSKKQPLHGTINRECIFGPAPTAELAVSLDDAPAKLIAASTESTAKLVKLTRAAEARAQNLREDRLPDDPRRAERLRL